MNWFLELTGFSESAHSIETNLELDGTTMRSKVNGRSMEVGELSVPSLAELNTRCEAENMPTGTLRVSEVVADVAALHADPANQGAFFQVVSQFNLLEMVSPSVVPESVLDAEGIERAPFVGFSRGGMIVASMIDACPDRMTAGVLGGTPLGAARTGTSAALQGGLAALLAGDWAGYWDSYPVPLPLEIKERFEQANDPKANGAALQALQDWPVDAGLSPTTVPRLAYFGTGEVFADNLRAELIAHEVEYVERDWAGHAETMSDAAGVSAIINDFLGD